ncbi:MarR family winged helix-turn-helix transcriptional regulator [Flexithrix dorotheae]|uniref:MarR family winged helix-turn-helix transcriptional regulator n=1 Tax=Flexithrix dorotheae TaxID=70993 RepID=UPI000380B3EF|nr:MarR family winged helix-turn-helix transcriptional regulator [Flexithrix dorotheae]
MKDHKVVEKIRAFNRFYTNVIAVLDQSVLNSGNSLAEARVLFEIRRLGPVTARQLMEAITIDEGYLSRILQKFVTNGEVLKKQSPADKRQFLLSLSEQGKIRMEELEHLANQATGELIQNLSTGEKENLLKSMEQITEYLDRSYSKL